MSSKSVGDLQAEGVLRVEDGNHGEYRPRRDEFSSDGAAFIRAANVVDGTVDFKGADRIIPRALNRIRKGIGRPRDILLTHKGTVGRVARVPSDAPPFVCSPQTTYWRVLDERQIDRAYLFAYLRSPAFAQQLYARMHGSDMAPYVSLTEQKTLSLDLPPLDQQQAIGKIISSFDDKIENNRRLAETCEGIAAALFKARFVDFVGDSDFADSEIGAIPKGWSVADIYEVASVTYGRPFKSSFFNGFEGIPLLRIRDLATHEPQVFTAEDRKDGRLIGAGDIVVGMDGEFRAHIWSGPDSWLNQRVCAFDPQKNISSVFVLEAIKRPLALFESTKSGTTVIHLGKADIDTFRVVKPPSAVMQEFVRQADPLLNAATAVRVEIRTLAAVRDALLPRLLSGSLPIEASGETEQGTT